MDSNTAGDRRERARRTIRNKYGRRNLGEDKRPLKTLFTPEIKRFLKDWLVRRRENPYPNRDEKKILALQTGLTYTQVCNWFANWRRKLKNAVRGSEQKTWGNLIKTYNNQVQGNLEHFSICSDNSIWEESEQNSNCFEESHQKADVSHHRKNQLGQTFFNENPGFNNNINENQNQCYFISSTTGNDTETYPVPRKINDYHSRDKYFDSFEKPVNDVGIIEENKPSMISKWLESAVNFKPSENSYLNWVSDTTRRKNTKKINDLFAKVDTLPHVHGREELDAAEALTTLANAKCKI
nr:BEL1-like homeodomain protein 10 [Leptinotarsa decemlineata]